MFFLTLIAMISYDFFSIFLTKNPEQPKPLCLFLIAWTGVWMFLEGFVLGAPFGTIREGRITQGDTLGYEYLTYCHAE